MKLRVTMKHADALDYAFRDAEQRLKAIAEVNGTEYDENDLDDIKEAVYPWFKYGEYLTVEIDTVTGTAEVIAP